MSKPHLEQARLYWEKLLLPDDIVIDATCGNGKDTLFLAERVPQGHVYTLDIQENALQKARLLTPYSHVTYLLQSHASFPPVDRLKLVVYNLGYLPGGDKNVTTLTSTTLQSLEKAADLLSVGGALSITCYPGHPEGALEKESILKWIKKINCHKWDVAYHQWHPQSAVLFYIVKLNF